MLKQKERDTIVLNLLLSICYSLIINGRQKEKSHFFSLLGLILNKFYFIFQNILLGTSLVVQWLGIYTPNAGGPGSIPGQGTRSHMPQLKKILHTTRKILGATTKTQLSQRNNTI